MKSILCYGDSNTWGRNPETRERFDEETRWPRVAQRVLGDGYLVIEEGLVGRTTVYDDPEWEDRNGKTFLPVAMECHMPLDLMVIALGSNDLKSRFGLSPEAITAGMEELVVTARAQEFCPPRISIICPAPCRGSIYETSDGFAGAVEKSRLMGGLYREVAERLGCGFVDAGEIAKPSGTDGLHFDAGAHRLMGEAMAAHIAKAFC
jgi:lysophospholipase L1-like esterase